MSENTNYWDRPDPPQVFFDRIESSFDQYLFYENLLNGQREYTCTACHKTFIKVPTHQSRIVKPEDVALWRAAVNDQAVCPKCGKQGIVKNLKLLKNLPCQMKCNIAMLVDSPDSVWLRCYISYKRTKDGKVEHYETMFYHLVPGDSYQFKSWGLKDSLIRQKLIENPFTWHHGVYTESYDYNVDKCGYRLEDTFLKYALPSKVGNCISYRRYHYIPDVKFLCWFARHPQIEFLMKFGHVEVVNEILDKHTDFKSLLNWEAKKPWELFKITHEEYKLWKDYKLDFSLYKVFRRLGVPGEKGWKLAKDIVDMISGGHWSTRVDSCYRFIAKCKKVKVPPREIINYLYKIQRSSGGGCWHCPGVTIGTVYNMWFDYIDLAIGAGKLQAINPMPRDLHKAHNQMIGAKKQKFADWKTEYKRHYKAGESYAAEYRKKFPRVEKIYQSLTDKFFYENDKYMVVVPRSIQEIYAECAYLRLCTVRPGVTRYWERVSRRESYMFFLRLKERPDQPYYLLEVEPCGTIRQKRSFDDMQYEDINDAAEFLKEWQTVIQKRMTSYDRKLAKKSKEQREKDLKDLHEKKVQVRTGYLTGQLLADVLEADLMEVSVEEKLQNKKQNRKVG